MADQDTEVVLDTPGQISAWVVLSRISQLALEVNIPGMKAPGTGGGSVLKWVQNAGWTAARTKKGALQDLVESWLLVDPNYTISTHTIGKALGCAWLDGMVKHYDGLAEEDVLTYGYQSDASLPVVAAMLRKAYEEVYALSVEERARK